MIPFIQFSKTFNKPAADEKNIQNKQRIKYISKVTGLTLLGLLSYAMAKVALLPSSIAVQDSQFHTWEETNFLSTYWKASPLEMALMEEAVPASFSLDKGISVETKQKKPTVELSILGIPLKKVEIDLISEDMIVPCGMTVGVHIRADGVMVLGTGILTDESGKSVSPADGILKPGDIIVSVNGERIIDKETLIDRVADSVGDLALVVSRNKEELKVSVTPAVDKSDGKRKLGCWIRESTKGIGTLTYYNPKTSKFGALGHGILDVDTQKLLTVRSGEILESSVVTVKPGSKGVPGELIGNINNKNVLGSIKSNTQHGLYGYIDQNINLPADEMEIASQGEVHEGPAKMLSNIDGKETKLYDVYLENVYHYSSDEAKGMVLRITDPELLTKTNGIVQGMSGSPLIQDNKIVGAVTHVFVQNPMKGYGIFIENMLKQEKYI